LHGFVTAILTLLYLPFSLQNPSEEPAGEGMIRAGVGVSLGVGSRKGRGKEEDLGEAQVGPSPCPEEGYLCPSAALE